VYYGAELGEGVGRTGDSYAIPTKDRQLRPLALDYIEEYVKQFLTYAKENPELTFEVTRIECGLAEYAKPEVRTMFEDAPVNCRLPVNWTDK